MQTCVLYFDGFAEFEIVIAVGNLSQKSEILPVALENRPYLSEEKQVFMPSRTIAEVDPGTVDILLIPGGPVEPLMSSAALKHLVVTMNTQKKLIGAICGGVHILGFCGVLEGRRFTCNARGFELDEDTRRKYFSRSHYVEEDVVVDGNIVTAMGQAFVEFGVEIADRAGRYSSAAERAQDYLWIKNL